MPISGRAQTLVVTAIPRGFADGQLRVGVHLSPRLSFSGVSETTLASFPDFNFWPPGGAWTWRASFDGGTTYVTPASITWDVDPELWKATFHAELPVRSFDGHPGPPRSVFGYSYNGLAQGLREMLRSPTIGASSFGRLLVTTPVSPDAVDPTVLEDPNDENPQAALTNYLAFMRPTSGTNLTATPVRGHLDPDFHQRLTLLSDHPRLMERLGLVAELRFPALPASAVVSTVRVAVDHEFTSGVPTTVVSMPTQVVHNFRASIFAAVTQSPLLDNQLRLRLDTPSFTVHSIDVDGVTAHALSAAQRENPEVPSVPPPAARSVGLTLARAGRAITMHDGLAASRAKALTLVGTPGTPPTATADQLIVGVHVQVLDENAPVPAWRGLGWREVTYVAQNRGELGGAQSFVAVDEAPVSAGAREMGGDSTRLAASDVIAKWDGWSLGVPLPGRHARQYGAVESSFEPVREVPANSWLEMTSAVPELDPDGGDARLPALRFGHAYRFRARSVDVTGFAHAWGGAATTAPVVFHRFEPVPAPIVLPPPALTRTEAPLRLVVRSNPRSGELAASLSVRTLVPDRAAVTMLLQHGMLDLGGAPDGGRWSAIATMDEKLLPVAGPPLDGRGQPTGLRVSWLPDPMSTACVVELPEVASSEASFLPPSATDDRGARELGVWQSVALALQGGTTGTAKLLKPTAEKVGHRVVTLRLPPGSSETLYVRCQPPGSRLHELGLAAWETEAGGNGGDMVRRGELPLVTPRKKVTLVHAVRQPLTDPVIDGVAVHRSPGEKDAPMTVNLHYPGSSSGRLTVVAKWSDWRDVGALRRDDPKYEVPRLVNVPRSVVVEQAVEPAKDPGTAGAELAGRMTFPDLRRRDLKVQAIATSCFVEEFRSTLASSFGTITGGGLTIYLKLPVDVDVESVRLSRAGQDLVRGKHYDLVANPAGKLTFALKSGVSATGIVVTGVRGTVLAKSVETTVIVPSAVRPDPPRPVYAVPAFKVTKGVLDADGHAVASRGDNRLRIWLERPWWSSGTGEKLAVITSIGLPLSTTDDSPLNRLVSQLGTDPILLKTGPVTRLTGAMNGTRHDLEVVINDQATSLVAFAGDVKYDAERDLHWAEFGLKAVPAGTFLRLAVARFQEHVAPGVQPLSEIVTMDPIALLPKRSVKVRLSLSKLVAVVTGTSHLGSSSTTRPYVRMSLQRKTVRGAGDDLGWDTVATVTQKVLADTLTYPQLELARPRTSGTYRLLFEECERWPTLKEDGTITGKEYTRLPDAPSVAVRDMVGERVTWTARTPLPTR